MVGDPVKISIGIQQEPDILLKSITAQIIDIQSQPIGGSSNMDESIMMNVGLSDQSMARSTNTLMHMNESRRVFTQSESVDQFHGIDTALGVSVIQESQDQDDEYN